MTEISQLRQLIVITQAQYDHQRQIFAKVLNEETRMREELQRLSDLDKAAGRTQDQIRGMRAIGADLLWRGWLSRSRTELNMQLARVLAIKEHEQEKVRQAFGKVVALEELIALKTKHEKTEVAKAALLDTIEMSVHKS